MASTYIYLREKEHIEARGITTANGPCVLLEVDNVTFSAWPTQARALAAALTKAADQAEALATQAAVVQPTEGVQHKDARTPAQRQSDGGW